MGGVNPAGVEVALALQRQQFLAPGVVGDEVDFCTTAEYRQSARRTGTDVKPKPENAANIMIPSAPRTPCHTPLAPASIAETCPCRAGLAPAGGGTTRVTV